MTKHLLALDPTDEFHTHITSEYADHITTFNPDEENEHVYKLHDLSRDQRNTLDDYLFNSSVLSAKTELDIPNRIQSSDPPTQRSITALTTNTTLQEIILNETPGGDIRKYTTDMYGIDNSQAIDCDVSRSCKPMICGFEPLTMDSIELAYKNDLTNTNNPSSPRYPPAARILEWSNRVSAQLKLEARAIGTIHLDKETIGFTGFCIIDADEHAKDWADKRWFNPTPDNIYMHPDEYSLDDYSDSPTDYDSILRMWWD